MIERKMVKIYIDAAAKDVVAGIAQKHDMSEQGVASRIYNWFGRQDEVIQAAILGLIPKDLAPEVARLVLEKMAGEGEAKAGEKNARRGATK